MKNMTTIKSFLTLAIAVLLTTPILGQDSSSKKPATIDPSKPTNLYTQFNTNLEYQSRGDGDFLGVRMNIQKAFNPNNLLLAEVPFLYNLQQEKFGLADMRVRYFNIMKRNITSKFIALGAFGDVTIPTGNFEKRFGGNSWSLAAGVITGFTFSKTFSFFPGISYVHLTKPTTDLIPESLKSTSDGIGLQFNASVRLGKTTFMFINPVPTFLNTKGSWSSTWPMEFSLNKILVPNKFKVNLNYNPNFTTGAYVLRLGSTWYL